MATNVLPHKDFEILTPTDIITILETANREREQFRVAARDWATSTFGLYSVAAARDYDKSTKFGIDHADALMRGNMFGIAIVRKLLDRGATTTEAVTANHETNLAHQFAYTSDTPPIENLEPVLGTQNIEALSAVSNPISRWAGSFSLIVSLTTDIGALRYLSGESQTV